MKSSLEDVKFSNRQVILNLLRSDSMLSRTQVAKETGLSKATVTRILNDMIKEEIVEEVRSTEGAVGRPHILLRLVYRTHCAIGIELTALMARITLIDLNARPIKQRNMPVYTLDTDALLDELAKEIISLQADISAEVVGVGIAVPGTVNAQTGIVHLELANGWQDVMLSARLSKKINLPVVVVNQAYAAAWGEKWYEGKNPVADLLYIRLGTLVEAGMVLGNQLHVGKLFTAGAIGHVTVDPHGEKCTCGNQGCLSTFASTPALLAKTRARLKENSSSMLMAMVEGKPSFLTMDHLMQAVKTGDSLAVEVLEEAARATGIVIAGLLNLLNFERVIIGGQLSIAGQALMAPLKDEVYRRALPSSLVFGRIELTHLGADGASIGAASLIFQDSPNAHRQS